MNETMVNTLPTCDTCCLFDESSQLATYDGKMKTMGGRWAYMCDRCFPVFGIGLGLGKGQKLILKESI